MKALEEELGKKLFTRHSFSIRLTDEGMLLRSRAEDLVSMADRIEQEFVSLDDITGGDLYLGLAESYQIRLLEEEVGFDIFERSGKGALLILFILARVENKTASRSRRAWPRPRHVFFRASAASNTPSMCRRCIVS
jgi:hypothetical protein